MKDFARGLTMLGLCFLGGATLGRTSAAGPDHTGKDLSRQDLRNRELVGAVFRDAKLYATDFTGAKLVGASFVGADLSQAKLDGADCTGADFTDAKFSTTMGRGTNFSKANLSGADLGGYSVFRGSRFTDANLRGVRGLKDLTECDFSGADLRGASLRDGEDWKAPSITWTRARYDDDTRFPKGVDPDAVGALKVATEAAPAVEPKAGMAGGLAKGLSDAPAATPARPAVGTGRKAAGQDWRNRDLRGSRFDDIDLSKAVLMGAQFQESSLRRADLRGADLSGARLDDVDLSGADLRGADLKGAHFTRTNLTGAQLEGQDLSVLWGMSDSTFRDADLRGLRRGLHVTVSRCDFRRADLRGAHVAGPGASYVATCDFRGAKYDDDTRWPKGFDVEGAGAVRVASAPGEEEDEGPDRLLAADRDPDAPPEGVVKKVFSDSVRDLAGYLILKFGAGGKGAPPVSAAVAYRVTYTRLVYLAAEEFRVDSNSAATVKGYPIDIEGHLTSEGRDGSERTDPFRWVVRFYRTSNDVWKCAQPEAKSPTTTK